MSVSDWIIWGGKWRGSLTFIKLSIPYVYVPQSPAWSYLLTRCPVSVYLLQSGDTKLLTPASCRSSPPLPSLPPFATLHHPWPLRYFYYSPRINACFVLLQINILSVLINILRIISTSTICSNVFINVCVPLIFCNDTGHWDIFLNWHISIFWYSIYPQVCPF